MTSISDKADEADGPEVVLTSDLGEAAPAKIATDQLVEADDLTPEGQFPEFGEFMEMRRVNDGETVYWECATSLADVVVEAVSEAEAALPGTQINVEFVAKAPSGEWRYTLDIDPDSELMDRDN